MRKKTKTIIDAHQKEEFINEMIEEGSNDDWFDVGNISNGTFTFDEISHFIIMKGLEKEFKEYLELEKTKIRDELFATNVLKKELNDMDKEDLPFSDL
jgi:arabinogalactan endo-1,4-beta-galactosidase